MNNPEENASHTVSPEQLVDLNPCERLTPMQRRSFETASTDRTYYRHCLRSPDAGR
jgi:hypothetical protein